MVSHELRTPLTSLLGFTNLLLTRAVRGGRPQALPRDRPPREPPARRDRGHVPRPPLDRGGPLELRRQQVDLATLAREQASFLSRTRPTTRSRSAARRAGARRRRRRPALAGRREPDQQRGQVLARRRPGRARRARAPTAACGSRSRDHGIGIPIEDQPRVFTKFFRGRRDRQRHPRDGPRPRRLARDRRGARRDDRLRQRERARLDLLDRAARATRRARRGTTCGAPPTSRCAAPSSRVAPCAPRRSCSRSASQRCCSRPRAAAAAAARARRPRQSRRSRARPRRARPGRRPRRASGVSGVASASNCRQLAELSGKLGQIFGGTPSGNTKQYAAFLHAFADRAPKEIRPDFQTLADAYGKLADALGNYNSSSGQQPSPAQLLKLMNAVQGMDQQKLNRAGLNISAWAKKNCSHP